MSLIDRSDNTRLYAARLSACSVITMLLKRHAKTRDKFAAVQTEIGQQVQEPFDELAELLAVHGARRKTLRPVSRMSHAELGNVKVFPDVRVAHTDTELRKPGDKLLAVVTWAR